MPRICLVIMLLQFSVGVTAYDPLSGHSAINNIALDLYDYCFPSENPYKHEYSRSLIVQGNTGMDEGLSMQLVNQLGLRKTLIFSPLWRSINWHFFNPDRQSLAQIILVDQSMSRLWSAAREGLERNKTEEQLLCLGAIMHLLEDISVPAHSVPVYHGPLSVKVLGPVSFMPLVENMVSHSEKVSLGRIGHLRMIKDPIDSLPVNYESLADFLMKAETCEEIQREILNPEALRQQLFEAVHTLLQAKIKSCPEIQWQHFWVKPMQDEYFGRYRQEYGQPGFGQGGRIEEKQASCLMQENDPRYYEFLSLLHVEAVMADLKLLYWASMRVSL